MHSGPAQAGATLGYEVLNHYHRSVDVFGAKLGVRSMAALSRGDGATTGDGFVLSVRTFDTLQGPVGFTCTFWVGCLEEIFF